MNNTWHSSVDGKVSLEVKTVSNELSQNVQYKVYEGNKDPNEDDKQGWTPWQMEQQCCPIEQTE